MNQEKRMYIRLRHRLQVKPLASVTLPQICQYIVDPHTEALLNQTAIYEITDKTEHLVVIDLMKVIHFIKSKAPDIEIESFGPAQCIVEIMHPRKAPVLLLVVCVWLLLFIGSGLAIMNFHEDVSMRAVHQQLFYMITGEQLENPWLLQIPYSIGIGAGMILFFNRIFKKKLNEEPGPLEVEMFLYQQSLDQYVVMHENREVQKKLNDKH